MISNQRSEQYIVEAEWQQIKKPMLRIQVLKFKNYLMFILFYIFTLALQKKREKNFDFFLKTSFFFNMVKKHPNTRFIQPPCIYWLFSLLFYYSITLTLISYCNIIPLVSCFSSQPCCSISIYPYSTTTLQLLRSNCTCSYFLV